MRNDWTYYWRADVLAKMGFRVTWKYGTRPEEMAYVRRYAWWGMEVLPWMDPPPDMRTWPSNRYDFTGIGICDGKETFGPWCSLADGSCEMRGLDGAFFIAPEPPKE